MNTMLNNPHNGSLFDDFLQEQHLYEDCSAAALKAVLARQLAAEMTQQHLTKKSHGSNTHGDESRTA